MSNENDNQSVESFPSIKHRRTFFHLKHFAKSEFFGLGYFTKSILVDKVNVFGEG